MLLDGEMQLRIYLRKEKYIFGTQLFHIVFNTSVRGFWRTAKNDPCG